MATNFISSDVVATEFMGNGANIVVKLVEAELGIVFQILFWSTHTPNVYLICWTGIRAFTFDDRFEII